jgi:hypothetical protein
MGILFPSPGDLSEGMSMPEIHIDLGKDEQFSSSSRSS